MTTPPETHRDATTIITWAVEMHALQEVSRTSAATLLERWFADAAARWPKAWRAARRSPRSMLWIAARSAALASFDDDARDLHEERSALREGPGQPAAIAQLLAVGDVLRHLGALPAASQDELPEPLVPLVDFQNRRAS